MNNINKNPFRYCVWLLYPIIDAPWMDTDIIGTCCYINFHKYDVEHTRISNMAIQMSSL